MPACKMQCLHPSEKAGVGYLGTGYRISTEIIALRIQSIITLPCPNKLASSPPRAVPAERTGQIRSSGFFSGLKT